MIHKTARASSRLDELALGTPNVHIAAINGVNDIDQINCLLRPRAARGCYVIGLQESKREGTSRIVSSRYRVYFSGDRSGARGRNTQHRAGPAIKGDIGKKAANDSIAIECIGACLMKA